MLQQAMMHSSLGMPCMCPSLQRATQSRASVTCSAVLQPRTLKPRLVKAQSFFSKLRQDSSSAGVYGSQGRDEYSEEDVADYFAYIGLLAVEGNYDSMDAIVASGMHPADILLVFASKENDTPKVEELLRAGADPNIKDLEGRTPLELCEKAEIKELLTNAGAK